MLNHIPLNLLKLILVAVVLSIFIFIGYSLVEPVDLDNKTVVTTDVTTEQVNQVEMEASTTTLVSQATTSPNLPKEAILEEIATDPVPEQVAPVMFITT